MVLHNFRPFYGRNEIILTVERDKPLIIIKANNDVGKTSLFKAFIWCLYGGLPNESRSNVNRTASYEGSGTMSVEIIFEHDGSEYTIIRSLSFIRSNINVFPNISNENLSIIKDGVPITFENIQDREEYIQAILPKDASQFFFFDGEEIQKYTRMEYGPSIKNAIEMVLGITELRNARKDLRGISKEIDREFDDLLEKKRKRDDASRDLKELGDYINKLEDELTDLEEQIKQVIETIEFCDENLSRFKEIEDKIDERIKVRERIKEIEDQLAELNKDQIEFNQNFGFLLITPFFKEFSKYGAESGYSWRRDSISALLASNAINCVCDREITPEIKEYFQRVVDSRSETYLQYISSKIKNIMSKFPLDLEEKLYKLAETKASLELGLSSNNNRKEELDKEIGDYKKMDEEIKRFEEMRERAEQSLNSYKETKIEKNYELTQKRSEYESKRNIIAKQMGADKDIKDIKNLLDSFKRAQKGINFVIENLVYDSKINVQELTSEVFLLLTNAPSLYKGVEITDDYEIKIKTRGGAIRNVWDQLPSAGQSQIISMSFISALNRFTAREAPIVIDTPIGRLDPIHKNNLIEYFPKIAPQVIILYQPNEMSNNDVNKIGNFISKEYEFKRDVNNPDITKIFKGDK